MKWWCISIILCSYGFLKEFRPSESFITPFLTTFKNFTIQEINQKIYPVGTYCYLSLLVLVFLLTDFLRYKPVLLVGSVSGVVTWSLLIWGTTIQEMQDGSCKEIWAHPLAFLLVFFFLTATPNHNFVRRPTEELSVDSPSPHVTVEFFYGLFLASEVAYYSYIYAKVDKKHYQKVTSHTRAAILLGRAIAGLSSQFLITININYLELNYFSVSALGITILVAVFLPHVPRSIYFHRQSNSSDKLEDDVRSHPENVDLGEKENQEIEQNTKFTIANCQTAFKLLYEDIKQFVRKPYVLQWSIWWALATCGYLQAIAYCQLLWQDIAEAENSTLYHGYVEFIYAVSGAIVAFIVGYIKINWRNWGEIFLGVLTISQGGLLVFSANVKNLYVSYIVFILYRDFYEAAITIATCEIAKHISLDSYALVFGINTFAALVFQTILTAVVVETLDIHIHQQFHIYGGFHFAIGLIFLVYGISRVVFCRRKAKKMTEETSS